MKNGFKLEYTDDRGYLELPVEKRPRGRYYADNLTDVLGRINDEWTMGWPVKENGVPVIYGANSDQKTQVRITQESGHKILSLVSEDREHLERMTKTFDLTYVRSQVVTT